MVTFLVNVDTPFNTRSALAGSVFDKLIWHTIGPKSFLFGTAQFSLRARWCS